MYLSKVIKKVVNSSLQIKNIGQLKLWSVKRFLLNTATSDQTKYILQLPSSTLDVGQFKYRYKYIKLGIEQINIQINLNAFTTTS